MENKREKVRMAIVAACPDLMELSFGCEVIRTWSDTTPQKIISAKDFESSLGSACKKMDLIHYKQGKKEHCHSGYNGEEYEGECQKCVNHYYDYKIIGHPITLAHVLRAIHSKKVGVDSTGLFETVPTYEDRIKKQVYWNLKKSFDEQEETVYEFLHTIIC